MSQNYHPLDCLLPRGDGPVKQPVDEDLHVQVAPELGRVGRLGDVGRVNGGEGHERHLVFREHEIGHDLSGERLVGRADVGRDGGEGEVGEEVGKEGV